MKFKFGDRVEVVNNKFYENVLGTIIAFVSKKYSNEVYTVRLDTKDGSIIDYTENTHFLEKI